MHEGQRSRTLDSGASAPVAWADLCHRRSVSRGGDVIGRRRVDTHFLALERLGADVSVGDAYKLEGKLKGADIFLDEPSVTGTENALMAAVRAQGTTVLRNAASEPHVQDLARF